MGDPQPRPAERLTGEEIRQGAQEYGETIDKMMNMNFTPVVAAGYTAQCLMGPNGKCVA